MVSFFIARRHLFSRKSHSVINIIAVVSVIAMAVPVMALVVILSSHNGLGDFIERMYSDFDSELRITPNRSQLFDFRADGAGMARLRALPEVEAVSRTVEQNVLLTYADRQWIAVMRGVDSLYRHVVPIESRIVQGSYQLQLGDLDRVVVGQGVAYALGISTMLREGIEIYAIKPGGDRISFLPTSLYTAERIIPSGIYALDEATDSRYIFVPLEFAQRLLGSRGGISALEIKLKAGIPFEVGKKAVSEAVGAGFDVKTRFEQKETIYRIVQQEKWIIYLLLMFVIGIAALSLVGSVVMLTTDKEKDREMLLAMGGTPRLLRRIFTWEGTLITAGGVLLGLGLGVIVAWIQHQFGLVEMAGAAFLMEAYPIRISGWDLLLIGGGVLVLGTLVSRLTTISVIKRNR